MQVMKLLHMLLLLLLMLSFITPIKNTLEIQNKNYISLNYMAQEHMASSIRDFYSLVHRYIYFTRTNVVSGCGQKQT